MSWGQNEPETVVVVAVVRVVPVAVRHATVLLVVVPTAAAKHPVLAYSETNPLTNKYFFFSP